MVQMLSIELITGYNVMVEVLVESARKYAFQIMGECRSCIILETL